ncbi:MAG: PSD1 and planctomycete cytochrome C domain-containing protein [Planctomycetaceae bacterium]
MTGLALFLSSVSADQKPTVATKKNKPKKGSIHFARDIKPIFANHCVKCHGPEKQEGGLRLDHRDPALRGGDSGALFVSGKSKESELIRRILSKDESEKMPPPEKANKPLSAQQIATLRKWIDEGGHWPNTGERLVVKSDHWAFQPLRNNAPPKFDDRKAKQWIRNPIDAFILAKLRERNIEPSPAADRYTLIKRLSYDLIGLPPTPEEVDAFVQDRSPNAYEKLVDRLLASKHFGERWGRHWLDKARYADSDGYEKDRPRNNAWRYRDWVIQAINQDMPFDQFTREQIAGDLLPNATPSQKLATAFHRQTLTNTEGGTDKEQFRVEAIFDRVATTGTVWLGLTVGCAQCHSHKYDPLTQAEYYQLFAFYNNGDETNTTIDRSPEAVAKYQKDKAAYDAKVKSLTEQLAALQKKLSPGYPVWEKAVQAKLKATSKNPIRFHDLKIEKLTSKSGAKLTPQKDGSILVTGKTPDTDTYILEARPLNTEITGFRIEALADKRLPNRGPGRTAHGNFVLTYFRIDPIPLPNVRIRPAPKFTKATHSFAQNKFPASKALERNPKTGWAISPQMGKNHHATFVLERPWGQGGLRAIRITLEQNYGGNHVLGMFRVKAMTGTQPQSTLPKEILSALAVSPSNRNAKQKAALLRHFALQNNDYRKLDGALAALKKKAPASPTMTVRVISQRTNNPRKTRIMRRGDFLQPQAEVQPETPAVLHPLKPRRKTGMPDRLDLANWLVDEHNPLTPRVVVNQVWSQLFGNPIVGTVNDFGTRGDKPTHPELLDWLGRAFMRGATPDAKGTKPAPWSRKALIRLIVNSATYRQSSRHRPELQEKDPQNNLLARQNRFRVQAETVRDIHLAASGLLSRKIGGPSVFPPMPADVAALSYAGNFRWNTSKGADRYRRGMYTFFKRTAPYPNLITFDCPDSNTTNVRRRTSNTPLMALTTLNNIVFVEASQAMARRVLTEKTLQTDEDRITRAFRLCVARKPTERELSQFQKLLESSRQWYASHPDDAKKLTGSTQANSVQPAELASWIVTCRIIMNLDEFITRE